MIHKKAKLYGEEYKRLDKNVIIDKKEKDDRESWIIS